MSTASRLSAQLPVLQALSAELLDDGVWLSLEELARSCRMGPEWILEHLEAGLLSAREAQGQWLFEGSALLRARRLAQLERTFDADPHLAALTVDLIEEVADLRRRLQRLQMLFGQGLEE
ncbi:chaperone modulator CbpM [Extensimonas vulgaris]|uniref:Chaperone modulatory protein CbpM n=1 Tax=Extensimonas vulgaris TaxID=1031594 RepID=A0A369AFP6_9BURK|nr:chaperone modulator CbpM [Extensimonas vulgaris]RCX08149.1 chaperone modulatory protein CbpM [Extensimonas vulgaris]TWI36332.1 chaperone modulatory protein CbpM [Extensimonas vulgaris]TXD13675.1 MerR family transcriptional regulator [Extensimonas vulgaris]